ncbi:UDP-GlcNAc--UDP-phosphate GlcNAc-1-phosphate transferase [Bacteroidota bacterium]
MVNYLLITFFLILASVIYLKLADKFNIIDKPNNRSSHTVPTIRGGGILFLVALWLFFFMSNYQFPYLVLGASLIGGISFIDDLKTLTAKLRLPFQFLAIFLITYQVGFENFPVWLIILILILGVGLLNGYNFMDGINGITGLYSLSVLIGMYWINTMEHILNPDLLIYLILSLVVFGFYNFRKKARFFAGDIGSITIAVVVFFLGLMLLTELKAPVLLLFVLVFAGDASLTLVYRKIIGEHITEPHRNHIYQKLVDIYKLNHLAVALGYGLLQGFVNVLIINTYTLSLSMQYYILTGVIFVFIILYLVFFYGLKKIKSKKLIL